MFVQLFKTLAATLSEEFTTLFEFGTQLEKWLSLRGDNS